MNVSAVNNIDYLNANTASTPFNISWAMGADSHSRDTLNYSFHHHSFWEAHFITDGDLTYGFNKKSVEVKSGQMIMIAPRVKHKVECHSEDFEKLTVAFEIEDDAVAARLNAVGAIALDGCNGITKSLLNVISAAEQKGAYRAERVMHELSTLMLFAAESVGCAPKSSFGEPPGDVRVIMAKKYINDNSGVLLTCDEVARYCRLSVKQLGRLFERHEGMGVLEYIHSVKLDAAREMLQGTELSVKEIAQSLGFTDAHYFSKFIMRTSGMSPTELRGKR